MSQVLNSQVTTSNVNSNNGELFDYNYFYQVCALDYSKIYFHLYKYSQLNISDCIIGFFTVNELRLYTNIYNIYKLSAVTVL